MDKIDPRIVNYKNLRSDDKKIIRAKMDVLKVVDEEGKELTLQLSSMDSLTRALYETAFVYNDILKQKIKESIINTMSSIISEYSHYITRQDTSDYFYGSGGDENE